MASKNGIKTDDYLAGMLIVLCLFAGMLL